MYIFGGNSAPNPEMEVPDEGFTLEEDHISVLESSLNILEYNADCNLGLYALC